MKKFVVIVTCLVILGGAVVVGYLRTQVSQVRVEVKPAGPKPLDKYTFAALKERQSLGSSIKFTQLLKQYPDYSVWQFFFESDAKKVSGIADLPFDAAPFDYAQGKPVATASAFQKPVIIMFHGFASQEEYYPGFGTEKVAAALARGGYVALAPDFLGYGSSDMPSKDVFEERFETYTTALNLVAGVCSSEFGVRSGGNCRLGFWGHSNGGQIALSVLEISGKSIPTVLWNPVSKPFPYSILYYTDTFEDRGKALRKALAKFEEDYNVELYSTPNFYSWIAAPVFLQQGELDSWVPKAWSDELSKQLAVSGKQSEYKVYPGADHNLVPDWNQAVADDLDFYGKVLR